MLEEKIDKAAEGIKSGIGWIRERKNKIIAGAIAGGVGLGGIALAYKLGKDADDDEYLCLEESDYEVMDVEDEEEEPEIEIETTIEVTEED